MFIETCYYVKIVRSTLGPKQTSALQNCCHTTTTSKTKSVEGLKVDQIVKVYEFFVAIIQDLRILD